MQSLVGIKPNVPIVNRQKGATLIVVMVLLIVMTFLGLGGMSNSNLQLSMVRNSQMQTSAYTAALTEINAQMNVINSNAQGADDQLIIDLVNAAPEPDGSRILTGVVAPDPAQPEFEILLDDVLEAADYAAYDTTLSVVQISSIGGAVSGFRINNAPVDLLPMQFISNVSVKNTGAQSVQVQAFNYMAPASQ